MSGRGLRLLLQRIAGAVAIVLLVAYITVPQATHLANLTTIIVQLGALYIFFFDQDLLARIVLQVRRLIRRIRWEHFRRRRTERAAMKPREPKQPRDAARKTIVVESLPELNDEASKRFVESFETVTPPAVQAPRAADAAPAQEGSPEIVEPKVEAESPTPEPTTKRRRVSRPLLIGGVTAVFAFVALYIALNIPGVDALDPPVASPATPAAAPATPSRATPLPNAAVHGVLFEVTSETRCWTLARTCTGSGANWIELGPLNDIDVSNPHMCLIVEGQTILLPPSWRCEPGGR